MMAAKKSNLGRGLSALLGDASSTPSGGGGKERLGIRELPIGNLRPGAYQPRHVMNAERIAELAVSVREKGILQPILVRPISDNDEYEIIAGERRWRAAQQAQLHDVPVIIKDFDDKETLEIALIENLQREDLNPLEEAEAYRRLMEEFGYTQQDLGDNLGKSRSHLANTMRLLGLPEPVKEMIIQGTLSAGHGRALLGSEDPVAMARQVVAEGLNVRQTEALMKKADGVKVAPDAKKAPPEKDADTLALERDLEEMLGLKTEITFTPQGGTLVLHYKTLEQLDDVLNRLSNGALAGGTE
ncbi:MAG: ParB/RepB/Spo0J family partition protein [Magnetospiraceae bacterium]